MKADRKKAKAKQLLEFVPQVRQEVRKIVWPSRRETLVTTAFVFGLAVVAAIYFMMVDKVLSQLIRYVLGFGS